MQTRSGVRIGRKSFIFFRAIASSSMCLVLFSACLEKVKYFIPRSSLEDSMQMALRTSYWREPVPVDGGVVAGRWSFKQESLEIEQSGDIAAVSGSFFEGSNFRAYGRVYVPDPEFIREFGTGWAPPSAGYLALSAPNVDVFKGALASDGNGNFLSVYGNIADATQNGSAFFSSSEGWTDQRSSITDRPFVVDDLRDPVNWSLLGKNFSAALLPSGDGFLAGNGFMILPEGPSEISVIQHYRAGSGWNEAAPLGPKISQLDVVGHGNGATTVGLIKTDSSDAVQLSSGLANNCILRAGRVWCWGSNHTRQLGSAGMGNGSNVPVQIVGLSDQPVKQVAVGGGTINDVYFGHVCVLMADTTVRCWGDNRFGQLGDGGECDNFCATPSVVVNGSSALTGVVSISASATFTCAALQNGTARCWGENSSGQLGNGSTTNANDASTQVQGIQAGGEPIQIVTGGMRWNTSAIRGGHACLLSRFPSRNIVFCWGNDDYGQRSASAASSNIVLLSVSHDVTAIAAGATLTTYAMQGSGSSPIYWANLGEVQTHNASRRLDGVVAGALFSCGIFDRNQGQIICAGTTAYGELMVQGLGTISNPVIMNLGSAIRSLSAGPLHMCAALGNGEIRCWGANILGSLGSPVDPSPARQFSSNHLPIAIPGGVPCSSGECVAVQGSEDRFERLRWVSNGNRAAAGFDAASDFNGTVIVTTIERDERLTCKPAFNFFAARLCQYRLFASVRGADGNWSVGTQIDSSPLIDLTTTALQSIGDSRQSSAVALGPMFAKPAIVHMGNGIFEVVFVVRSIEDPAIPGDDHKSVTQIFSRRYQVGVGWAQDLVKIYESDRQRFNPLFKNIADIRLASDGRGTGFLIAKMLTNESNLNTNTAFSGPFGYIGYRYSSGSWQRELTQTDYVCDSAQNSACDYAPFGAAVFGLNHAVTVFPVTDNFGNIRLYSSEFFDPDILSRRR